MGTKKSMSDLDNLKSIEDGKVTGVNNETEQTPVQPQQPQQSSTKKANILDGYVRIMREDLPQAGILYPENWEFAYRSPTAKEVANFSTINEQDQPGVIVAVEDLIRKCVIIFDTATNKRVDTGEICDAHRTWFLLKLREQYLPGKPITYRSMCQTCHETFDATLTAEKLQYPFITDKLIEAYDGRVFKLHMGPDIDVSFRVPTIDTTGKIFKHLIKFYRNNQNNIEENKSDNVMTDKQFLLLAPYLFVSGNETIRDLTFKFKAIQKNSELLQAYLEIVTRLKLDNLETFDETCSYCGSMEETQLKFPGGWKKLFISTIDTTGYFG